MSNNIEGLLSAYERGPFGRRQFVAAISALMKYPVSVAAITKHNQQGSL